MSDRISRLMDGELDDAEFEIVWAELDVPDAHGDLGVLPRDRRRAARRARCRRPGFAERFAARLAAEPTVLAPGRAAQPAAAVRLGRRRRRVAAVTRRRLGRLRDARHARRPPIAKAREAADVRAAQVRPPAMPADYLLAHQEYSPTARDPRRRPGLPYCAPRSVPMRRP